MRTHTKETQEILTPQLAIDILKEGNARFVSNVKAHRNLLEQVNETSAGQFPFAAILSCIDSMSLNPDTVLKTTQLVLDTEKRLGR